MTEKARVLRQLRTLSSGTIAGFIGSQRYSAIDAAICKTILYASRVLTEDDCKRIVSLPDIAELIHTATHTPDLTSSPGAADPDTFAALFQG